MKELAEDPKANYETRAGFWYILVASDVHPPTTSRAANLFLANLEGCIVCISACILCRSLLLVLYFDKCCEDFF